MLSIRIVAVAALSLMVVGSAAAQTAPAPAGRPLQLLKIVEQPNHRAKQHHARRSLRPAVRVAAKRKAKRHVTVAMVRRTHHRLRQAAASPKLAGIWPVADTTTTAAVPAAAPLVADAAPPPAAPTTPEPSQAVADQAVPTASANVADEGVSSPVAPVAQNEADAAAVTPAVPAAAPAAMASPAPSVTTNTAMKGDKGATAAVAQSLVATPTHARTSAVGSAAWIAQVLAALGGAVAAGTIAWFLMGSTPQRTYG